MSERSIYLRDQADKCRQHADTIRDARTQEELRKLAAVYIARRRSDRKHRVTVAGIFVGWWAAFFAGQVHGPAGFYFGGCKSP